MFILLLRQCFLDDRCGQGRWKCEEAVLIAYNDVARVHGHTAGCDRDIDRSGTIGLSAKAQNYPGQLSGGQQQRATIGVHTYDCRDGATFQPFVLESALPPRQTAGSRHVLVLEVSSVVTFETSNVAQCVAARGRARRLGASQVLMVYNQTGVD